MLGRMELTLCGAAGEVTGSCHHLRVGGHQVLLDCGLYQGSREDELRNAVGFPFDPRAIDAVLLSHAHLDHCGRLPMLVRGGFRGPILSHPASLDLVRILLRDAAHLQQADNERENRRRARRGEQPRKPLFELADVERVFDRLQPVEFGQATGVVPGIDLTLHRAGHILGAASLALDLAEGGRRRRLVYSGDIGPDGSGLLPDPEPPGSADLVLMESTYGDRNHRSRQATLDEIEEVLDLAWQAGGNLLVPSFAIGRAQELMALFAANFERWRLDRWQIFLDSPMAIEATRVHDRHFELFSDAARKLVGQRELHALLPNLHRTQRPEQSMKINAVKRGALVIAGSGMCSGGRILHHLRHNLWRRECHVMIIGYQSAGTLGRKLVDGSQFVRIYGEDIRVAATVHTIGGLSAHAGQDDLLAWYQAIAGRPPVHLVHGEERGREGLATCLRERLGVEAGLPGYGDRLAL